MSFNRASCLPAGVAAVVVVVDVAVVGFFGGLNKLFTMIPKDSPMNFPQSGKADK